VPADALSQAYRDHPMPIGHGQTISQPYIVGYMTELLDLKPDDRVLEIGTGSAYQAAILAEIVREVVSIEIIDALAQSAAKRIRSLGYKNITVISGDGYFGWEERAPYDAIIVTAAAKHVPPPLVKQLKPGGRMAIPVGRTHWTQNLMVVEKALDGSVKSRDMLPVRFVPLTRKRR
jgi:protein-L-isoaspartate(D-aspartate) O-methyltransferase